MCDCCALVLIILSNYVCFQPARCHTSSLSQPLSLTCPHHHHHTLKPASHPCPSSFAYPTPCHARSTFPYLSLTQSLLKYAWARKAVARALAPPLFFRLLLHAAAARWWKEGLAGMLFGLWFTKARMQTRLWRKILLMLLLLLLLLTQRKTILSMRLLMLLSHSMESFLSSAFP